MELKIDTAKDSKEDLKRVIDFLQTFVAQQNQVVTPEVTTTHNDEPAPAMMTMFDIAGPEDETENSASGQQESVTNEPEYSAAEPLEQAETSDHQESMNATTKANPVTIPSVPKTEKKEEEVTKIASKPTMAQLLRDPLKIMFKKNDNELDEVQRLKKASKTTSENLRIIAYQ